MNDSAIAFEGASYLIGVVAGLGLALVFYVCWAAGIETARARRFRRLARHTTPRHDSVCEPIHRRRRLYDWSGEEAS